MKRKHSLIRDQHATYFLTTSVTEFTRLFHQETLAQIVLDNLSFYIQKYAVKLHGFVIMPNHFHLLLTMGEPATVSIFMGKLKGHSAKQIVQWCQEQNEEKLLDIFAASARKYKQTYEHQVWQERFDELMITRVKTFNIKLNYIHNNPVQERWQLCTRPELYRFSSARYYVNSEDVGVPITTIV